MWYKYEIEIMLLWFFYFWCDKLLSDIMWSFNGFVKVFVIFGFYLLCKFIELFVEECEKINDCLCRKSNGKVINLREIDGGFIGLL